MDIYDKHYVGEIPSVATEKTPTVSLTTHDVKRRGKMQGHLLFHKRWGTTKNGQATWNIQCLMCGRHYIKAASALERSKKTCCGCTNDPMDRKQKYKKKVGDLIESRFMAIKRSAAKRNINFHDSITMEFLWHLYQMQGGACAMSGEPINLNERGEITASLDRKDSKGDYSPTNVQWVHKIVNGMKYVYTEEVFIRWCRKVAKHNTYNDKALRKEFRKRLDHAYSLFFDEGEDKSKLLF